MLDTKYPRGGFTSFPSFSDEPSLLFFLPVTNAPVLESRLTKWPVLCFLVLLLVCFFVISLLPTPLRRAYGTIIPVEAVR